MPSLYAASIFKASRSIENGSIPYADPSPSVDGAVDTVDGVPTTE
jgi:hypothetical protein